MTSAIEDCFFALNGDEDAQGACGLIDAASAALSVVSSIDARLAPLYTRLEELKYAAEDITEEIRELRGEYAFSPEDMESIEARLDLIHRLKRKYGSTIAEILECFRADCAELNSIEFSEETLMKLQKKLDAAEKEANALADQLSESRKTSGMILSEKVMASLEQLDMPKVRFWVKTEEMPQLGPKGRDSIRFLLSANAGEELRSISKVASGGELSRIMLAMKNVLAENDDIDTLIFDEVDTGVSGRAAQRVAEKIADVSRKKQVLCVTHLPQLAAMADHHFLIEKQEKDGRTYTSVTPLPEADAAKEVARIISGASITDTTLQNARELIRSAQVYKNRI